MGKEEIDFTWANCELSGYRKGYVTVKLDFKTNILSWKDSNYWFNNFVRGLPTHQMLPIYDALKDFIKQNIDHKPAKLLSPQDYVWHIQAGSDLEGSPTYELSGYDVQAASWKKLLAAIEKVAQREFKL